MSSYFPPQMVAAGVRAVLGAALLFGLTALGSYQVSADLDAAVVAGAIAALTNLAVRFGVEGTYDARRNAAGNVKPADVGAYSAPLAE